MSSTHQIEKLRETSDRITNDIQEFYNILSIIKKENEELRSSNVELLNDLNILRALIDRNYPSKQLEELSNTNKNRIGLVNLTRLNEEAIFDAINNFKKSCPYCGKDLYEGNIRRKIEVDHFYPISKGGQDFPWNILPCCKECNRKKKDKMPYDFLSYEKHKECQKYLDDVLKRITSAHEDKIQNAELTYSLALKYLANELSKDNFINELLVILKLAKENYPIHQLNVQIPTEIIKVFFDCIKSEKDRFIDFSPGYNKIIFSLAEAIKIYHKKLPTKTNKIDTQMIRNIFKVKHDFILEYGKVMKIKSQTSRCLILNYSKMSEEWKNIFNELLELRIDLRQINS